MEKKEQKRSNRYPRDTDHSKTMLKEKKENAVQRRLDIPLSPPVEPEDKCNVLSVQSLVIRKLVPLFTILCRKHSEKAKAIKPKLFKKFCIKTHSVLNRGNTSFLSWEATSGIGRFASLAAPDTTITVNPTVWK